MSEVIGPTATWHFRLWNDLEVTAGQLRALLVWVDRNSPAVQFYADGVRKSIHLLGDSVSLSIREVRRLQINSNLTSCFSSVCSVRCPELQDSRNTKNALFYNLCVFYIGWNVSVKTQQCGMRNITILHGTATCFDSTELSSGPQGSDSYDKWDRPLRAWRWLRRVETCSPSM
jgi:hypothetical protein